jgi:lysophospholipase L1-like esterase
MQLSGSAIAGIVVGVLTLIGLIIMLHVGIGGGGNSTTNRNSTAPFTVRSDAGNGPEECTIRMKSRYFVVIGDAISEGVSTCELGYCKPYTPFADTIAQEIGASRYTLLTLPGGTSGQLLRHTEEQLMSYVRAIGKTPDFCIVQAGTENALHLHGTVNNTVDNIKALHRVCSINNTVPTVSLLLPPLQFDVGGANPDMTYYCTQQRHDLNKRVQSEMFVDAVNDKLKAWHREAAQQGAMVGGGGGCGYVSWEDLPAPVGVRYNHVSYSPDAIWSDCAHLSPKGYAVMGRIIVSHLRFNRSFTDSS